MSGRDWTKERWRKQYIREPLQHRAWPVVARALRELLNALAEDDGTLVRDVDDPTGALLRGLNAQEYELELVQAAIELLREGFLEADEHSVWIPDLPRAQAQRDAPAVPADRTPPAAETRPTSTERVRAFRARERERNAAAVSNAAVPETSNDPPPVSDDVLPAVSPVSIGVSSSRGNSHLESSEPSEIQRKPEKIDHPDQSSRARGIVSARSRDVSAELVSTRWTDDEVSKLARNPEQALNLPVHERAVFLRAHPRLADALQPERWPEVEAIGAAFAEGIGQAKQYLGPYEKDEGVRRVVELLAVGLAPMQQRSVMKLYRLSQSEFRGWRDRDAREALKKRVFEQHGDTQLRAPSGRILGTARAPEKSARVPIEKSVVRGTHHAVSPRECICREWQKPAGKEAEHHPICVHKQHWEAQQRHSPDAPRERAVVNGPSAEVTADAAPDTERAPAPPPVCEPAGCVCQQWAGIVEGKHHPLCTFRKAWEEQQGEVAPQLVELETGKAIREASAEEVSASKQKATEDGVGAIQLSDGKLYYVKEA